MVLIRCEMKKESDDIVLICNPSAGGRWKQLAGILDSAEAQQVRRIVTDSIDDIRPALASLSKRVHLVCIYGGDGTIQKILSDTFRTLQDTNPIVCLVGGGTMNVCATWCGWDRSPEKNFRRVVREYLADKLVTREVPLLEIRQGERLEYGFTFGMGSVIRILDEYDRGKKGKVAALKVAVKSIVAIWSKIPANFQPLLEQMTAEIIVDGERLPYSHFSAVFCNITGRVVRLVHPFTQDRQRETFYMLAYSVNARELSMLLPFLVRGGLPIDPRALIKPVSGWKQIGLSYFGRGSLQHDPRYVNRTAREFEVRSSERVFTIDGEILQSTGEPITVRLGPTVRLAVSPQAYEWRLLDDILKR
jgi:hypothetical protein